MTPQRKRILYILSFAFVFAEGIFRLLVFLLNQEPRNSSPAATMATLRPICYAMAGVALLTSIGWTYMRTRYSTSWQRFQSNVIVSLALAEACTIFGLLLFFLGGPANEINGFIIATVMVDLVVILPQIRRFD